MADNYGHPAEPTTCYLALYESFEIERNYRAEAGSECPENLLQSSTLMMDGAMHVTRSWYAPKANAETIFEDIQY